MPAYYSLVEIQALARQGMVIMTKRATQEALAEFDFSPDDVCEVVQTLTPGDFYKTDLSTLNHKPLDAYRKAIYAEPYKRIMTTYIKFQLLPTLLIVSFHSANF